MLQKLDIPDNTNHDDKFYLLALSKINGVGSVLTRQLVSYLGSAQAAINATKGQLKNVPSIGQGIADKIIEGRKEGIALATAHFERLAKNGHTMVSIFDSQYPANLKLLYDAPLFFYTDADTTSFNNQKVIGIVGTRNATPYGKQITEDIVTTLAQYNPIIVSGLAYGIDITAHKAALAHGMATYGVVANGLNTIYPKIHEKTANTFKESGGGLITEYEYDITAERHHFPARNRIIVGLCDAIIIVESGLKSGTLITANLATEAKKKVFAVPGRLTDTGSAGCNQLIASGLATCFSSVDQIVNHLNWSDANGNNHNPIGKLPIIDTSAFTPDEKIIFHLLQNTTDMHVDEIAISSAIPINKLASVMLNLEFMGIIKMLPGKRFSINKTLR